LSQCTPHELSEHISLLRKQAKGCENHAIELESYVTNGVSLQAAENAGQMLAAVEPA
jgi:hypothetical protein